ncbi:MAG: hypothetical protein ABJA16_11310 [Nakamurella sp.]
MGTNMGGISSDDVAGLLIDRRFLGEEFMAALDALTDQLPPQFHV